MGLLRSLDAAYCAIPKVRDLAWPQLCLCCGGWSAAEGLCRVCLAKLRNRSEGWTHLSIPGSEQGEGLPVFSLAPYGPEVKSLLHALKYGGCRRMAHWILDWLPAPPSLDGALLVPVPVPPSRLRRRGYNQAQQLALAVAARYGGLVTADVLKRSRSAGSQVGRNAKERMQNQRNGFRLARHTRSLDFVSGERIVLVDDVLTTGATLLSCAEVLRGLAPGSVSALTVAREDIAGGKNDLALDMAKWTPVS